MGDATADAKALVAEEYAERADAILAAIVGVIGDAVIAINTSQRIIAFNHGAETIFGYNVEEALGAPVAMLLPEGSREAHRDAISAFAREDGGTRRMGERRTVEGLRRDGTRFDAGVTIASIEQHGEWLGIAIVRDISTHVETRNHLLASLHEQEILAHTDPLTNLWNRRTLERALEKESQQVGPDRMPFSLVYMDLDHFKQVNDQYGHGFGDAILKDVACSLNRFFRSTDLVARVGGDEFAVLVPASDAEGVQARMTRLHEQLSDEMLDHGVTVTFSIGVITCGRVPTSPEACLEAVDTLMYRVKHATRDGVVFGVLDEQGLLDADGPEMITADQPVPHYLDSTAW